MKKCISLLLGLLLLLSLAACGTKDAPVQKVPYYSNPVVSEPPDPGVAYDDYRQFDVISGLRDTAQPITETLIYTLYFQDDQAVANIVTATLADGFSTESTAYAELLDALDELAPDAEVTLTDNLLMGVINELSKNMVVRDEDKAFIARVFSYAFVGLMLDWIKDDMRADPEALVERFALVIHNDLSSALERFRVG